MSAVKTQSLLKLSAYVRLGKWSCNGHVHVEGRKISGDPKMSAATDYWEESQPLPRISPVIGCSMQNDQSLNHKHKNRLRRFIYIYLHMHLYIYNNNQRKRGYQLKSWGYKEVQNITGKDRSKKRQGESDMILFQ